MLFRSIHILSQKSEKYQIWNSGHNNNENPQDENLIKNQGHTSKSAPDIYFFGYIFQIKVFLRKYKALQKHHQRKKCNELNKIYPVHVRVSPLFTFKFKDMCAQIFQIFIFNWLLAPYQKPEAFLAAQDNGEETQKRPIVFEFGIIPNVLSSPKSRWGPVHMLNFKSYSAWRPWNKSTYTFDLYFITSQGYGETLVCHSYIFQKQCGNLLPISTVAGTETSVPSSFQGH